MLDARNNLVERYNLVKTHFGYLGYAMMNKSELIPSFNENDTTQLQLKNCPDNRCLMRWTQTESGFCKAYNRPPHLTAFKGNSHNEYVASMIDFNNTDESIVMNAGSGNIFKVVYQHFLRCLHVSFLLAFTAYRLALSWNHRSGRTSTRCPF